MKRILGSACLIATLALSTGAALADGIAGRPGITGRLGFSLPSKGEIVSGGTLADYDTDAAFIGGGGFIYGIDKNFAIEFDITRSSFGSEQGDAGITNLSFGAQYRFSPQEKLVPYAGGGLDILINDLKGHNVDTVMGIHLSGGADYFILKDVALNAEGKIVLSPEADIENGAGARVGRFNPSGFTGTVGVRYFFK